MFGMQHWRTEIKHEEILSEPSLHGKRDGKYCKCKAQEGNDPSQLHGRLGNQSTRFFLGIDEVLTHAEVMEKAIFLLKDCDAMILCAGWQDSKGCQEEYVYAKENGIRVIPFFKWMMGI